MIVRESCIPRRERGRFLEGAHCGGEIVERSVEQASDVPQPRIARMKGARCVEQWQGHDLGAGIERGEARAV